MESLVVRPAQAGDAADLARNWLDAARHYTELDADAFQVPAADGLVEWFEQLLGRPRSDDAVWLVAEVDDRVVGDVLARLEPPVGDALDSSCAAWAGCGCGSTRSRWRRPTGAVGWGHASCGRWRSGAGQGRGPVGADDL
jgi:hypothetical protein